MDHEHRELVKSLVIGVVGGVATLFLILALLFPPSNPSFLFKIRFSMSLVIFFCFIGYFFHQLMVKK
jgi:hypothetical protein